MTLAAFQSVWCPKSILASVTLQSRNVVGRLELWIHALCCDFSIRLFFSFFFFSFCDRGIVHPRQMMKVPNEPRLSPNNGLENV